MRVKQLVLTFGAIACLATAADNGPKDSLFQRLGGMPALRAVVDDFVPRILADARLQPWFGHTAAHPEMAAVYKAHLAEFVCQATGGPCRYSGADMETVHKGRGITPEAFDAVVEDLVATLVKLNVPEKEQKQLLGLLAPMRAVIVTKPSANQ